MTLFGNLDAAQQSLYESQPGVAFQYLMKVLGQGDPNFANTALGRYIASQQQAMSNNYMAAAAQEQANWASGADQRKSAWQQQHDMQLATAKWNLDRLNRQFDIDSQAYNTALGSGKGWTGAVPSSAERDAAQNQFDTLSKATYTPGTDPNQLTWTKYLDQNANLSQFTRSFNLLGAAQRGAQPGAFMVRRNLW